MISLIILICQWMTYKDYPTVLVISFLVGLYALFPVLYAMLNSIGTRLIFSSSSCFKTSTLKSPGPVASPFLVSFIYFFVILRYIILSILNLLFSSISLLVFAFCRYVSSLWFSYVKKTISISFKCFYIFAFFVYPFFFDLLDFSFDDFIDSVIFFDFFFLPSALGFGWSCNFLFCLLAFPMISRVVSFFWSVIFVHIWSVSKVVVCSFNLCIFWLRCMNSCRLLLYFWASRFTLLMSELPMGCDHTRCLHPGRF